MTPTEVPPGLRTRLVALVFALVAAAGRGRPPLGRQLRPLVLTRTDAVLLLVLVAQLDQLPDAAAALLAGGDVLVVGAAAGLLRPVFRPALGDGRCAVLGP